jgi:hypothetical protein
MARLPRASSNWLEGVGKAHNGGLTMAQAPIDTMEMR